MASFARAPTRTAPNSGFCRPTALRSARACICASIPLARDSIPQTEPDRLPAAPRSDRQPFDGVALLVAPAVLILCALFLYPFAYGLWLSFAPAAGGALA